MTLRVGIIGAGFGAAVHLPVFRALEGVSVAAIADGGSGRAEAAVVGLADAPDVVDAATIIKRADIDAVSIAVPPSAQADLALRALTAGKAVLCEKPVGRGLAETRALADEAATQGAVNAAGFGFRYDPGIRALRDALSAGGIGAVERIDVAWLTSGGARRDRPWDWRSDRSAGGGIVNNFLVHVADYLRWLTGSEIADAVSRTGIRIAERPGPSAGACSVTAPDVVESLFAMTGGVRASAVVSNAYATALGHRIEVTGTNGRLTFLHRPPFSPGDLSVLREGKEGPTRLPIALPDADPAQDSRAALFRGLAMDFVAAIRGEAGSGALPTFADALAARGPLPGTEDESGQ